MNQILGLIDIKKKTIEQHELCKWMSNAQIDPKLRLSFVPSMLFFIMGFSDILKEIKVKNPQTKLDYIINTHCDEDSDHWRWYLKDLENLGFSLNDWGGNVSGVFSTLWDEKLYPTRKLVYESIKYAQNAKDPVLKLILIEVMEATFGAFTINMIHPLKETSYYKALDFFGHTHEHAEDNHSLGSWTSDETPEEFMHNIKVESSIKYEAVAMIDHLFDLFSEMFDCWLDQKGAIVNFNERFSIKDNSTTANNLFN